MLEKWTLNHSMKSKHSIRVCNILIHRKFRKSWANFHIKFLSLNISPFRTMQEFWSINKHWYKETRCIWSLYIDIGLLVPGPGSMRIQHDYFIFQTYHKHDLIYDKYLSSSINSAGIKNWTLLTRSDCGKPRLDLKLNLGLHFFTLRLPLTFSFPHSAFKMIWSLVILYLSALGFLLPVLAQGTCVINDFEVQTNFVPEQFSGLWHLAGYNRMMRPVTRLPPRIAKITTRYVKSLYALGEDGRGTIRSSKGIFVE